jgi:hypothetical protein
LSELLNALFQYTLKVQPTPEQLPYWVRIAGALGPVLVGVVSVILSLALAFLYNEQKKLQEANHKAALDVVNWEWDGDRLEVDVVNHGNGVAQDIKLTTLAHADNGAHRKFSSKSNLLKRTGQDNPWANSVDSDGEVKKLGGRRRVGKIAPQEWSRDWMGINFRNFVQEMKELGVKELKYCFVIQGRELSNRKVWTFLRQEMMITNPQDYSPDSGLGPVTLTSHDGTFDRYFSQSFFKRWSSYLYVSSFMFFSMIPFLDLKPRVLDVSGTSRVKRLLLRRRIKRPFRVVIIKLKNTYQWVARFLRTEVE